MTIKHVDLASRREALKKTAALLGSAAVLPLALRSGALSAAVSEASVAKARAEVSSYSRLIAVLSELIIPKTDTAGAIEAGVPEYIKLILTEWYSASERKAFLSKMDVFDKLASKARQQSFSRAPNSVQTDLLRSFEKNPQSNIFSEFKSLTVFGYYTSEAATKELNYSLIPSGYKACVPLEEIGRTWLQDGI